MKQLNTFLSLFRIVFYFHDDSAALLPTLVPQSTVLLSVVCKKKKKKTKPFSSFQYTVCQVLIRFLQEDCCLAPGLTHWYECPLNGCPFSTLMGPLSTLANTTAIIAGKASGELTGFCPGQLEHESFESDNAAEVDWERHMEEDISRSWPGSHSFSGFWKRLFDLWPHHHVLLQSVLQRLWRPERCEQHPRHIRRGLQRRLKST